MYMQIRMRMALFGRHVEGQGREQGHAHGGRESGEHADDDAELGGPERVEHRPEGEHRDPSASPKSFNPSNIPDSLGKIHEEQVLEDQEHRCRRHDRQDRGEEGLLPLPGERGFRIVFERQDEQ
ncbi:MAG: hypothetical protein MZV65_16190 [Chromatiales bacterium]|nr:hypothetical protein [Chromatiales bacterium]